MNGITSAEAGMGGAADSPRSVTILGSTGSVGANTVDLIRREPGRYRVECGGPAPAASYWGGFQL